MMRREARRLEAALRGRRAAQEEDGQAGAEAAEEAAEEEGEEEEEDEEEENWKSYNLSQRFGKSGHLASCP